MRSVLLCEGSTGGCSNIMACLADIFDTMTAASNQEEGFDKIVVVTDRDEIISEEYFLRQLENTVWENHISVQGHLKNNQWITLSYNNGRQHETTTDFLLLMIPFEEEGALETFLLNALSQGNEYDGEIIRQGNEFVDHADPQNKYLCKRRYRTKAKFDVFFCIRTALEQFEQRRSVLREIPWEDYEAVHSSFEKLRDLGVQ